MDGKWSEPSPRSVLFTIEEAQFGASADGFDVDAAAGETNKKAVAGQISMVVTEDGLMWSNDPGTQKLRAALKALGADTQILPMEGKALMKDHSKAEVEDMMSMISMQLGGQAATMAM